LIRLRPRQTGRPSPCALPSRLGLLLVTSLVAQLVLIVPVSARAERAPAPDALSVDPAAPPRADEPAAVPGAHYEEAQAHAADRIAFKPGGRVDVPFTPRAADRAPVGGVSPRKLPAGRATGVQMAAAPQGSRWADTESVPAPVDAPAIPPADVPPADGALASEPVTDPLVAPTATGLVRQVYGFLPYWELSDSSTVLDYGVLSTVAYFSVGADRDGNLLKRNTDGSLTSGWGGWTSSGMTNVINAAHSAGTRIALTVTMFAWTTNQAASQAALLGNPTARLNLARQTAAAVRDRGADGINLDFEPIAAGYEDEFTALVRAVRAELDAVAPGYQLTFDTTGWIGNYPIEAATAPGGADAIFIMGYDYRTAGSNPVGSIDPLGGPVYEITDTLDAYTARVPASRLILGVPYYGRVWSTDTELPHAQNVSGTKNGASTSVIYSSAVDLASTHGRRWDATDQGPYVAYRRENCTTTYGCVTSWRQLWYDDAASLKLRYDLVNSYGLAGAGIWALGYDDGRTELNQALGERFAIGADWTPPRAGVKVLPTRQRDAGFTVTWTGTDVSGIRSWDVQVSADGGAFAPWLTGTTRTSDVYLARTGLGYAFRVRATDTKGNVGAWNVTSTWKAAPALAVGGFGVVRTDGLAMRSAPSSSASRLGELNTGQLLAVVGGPVSADGYTWWQVTGPLREWGPVSAVSTSWVAAGPSTERWLTAYRAPNSTVVEAGLRDYAPGDPATTAVGRTFSPNGDGRRDALSIRWTNAMTFDGVGLKIFRPDGRLVGTIPVARTAAGAQRVSWNGTIAGTRVADGQYIVAVSGSAGGLAYWAPSSQPATPVQLAAYGVIVDTAAPSITAATLNTAAFSPNGDGVLDTVQVAISSAGITGWGASVVPLAGPSAGTTVRAVTGSGATAAWSWDGRTDAGSLAPQGRYRLTLWASDAAGNRASKSWDVILDNTRPTVSATVDPGLIAPNGDGALDTAALAWSSGEAAAGRASIRKGTTVMVSWTAATTGRLAWDGTNAAGSAIPDGPYTFRVDVADAAGNRTLRDVPVVVDRTASAPRWTPALFYPHDGDAQARTSTVSFRLARTATTTLQILTSDNRYVKTAWRDRALAAGTWSWAWNGKAGSGILAPRGWYRAVLTVRSTYGTVTLSRLVLVDAFRITLSPSRPAGGDTLSIAIRTAELLAAAPQVTFTQAGRAAVTRTATKTGTIDYTVSFPVATGAAGPATIVVTGKDIGGGTNTKAMTVTVR